MYFNQYFVNIGHTLASKLNDVEPESYKKIWKAQRLNYFHFK